VNPSNRSQLSGAPGLFGGVHKTCGQKCGQGYRKCLKGASLRARTVDAHFFDKYNANGISHLHTPGGRDPAGRRSSAETDGGVHK
jgi:hypothetical protein